MDRLGLKPHPEKTRMVDLRRGQGSFVFLGCTIRKKRSIQRNPHAHYVQRRPKAMKRVRERVHELTDSRHSGQDVKQIIATLNPVLRGWGNYFRTGAPTGSSIGWTAMSISDWLTGRAVVEGSAASGWKSGLRNVLSRWVCISCVEP
jgi:hypothetical protein